LREPSTHLRKRLIEAVRKKNVTASVKKDKGIHRKIKQAAKKGLKSRGAEKFLRRGGEQAATSGNKEGTHLGGGGNPLGRGSIFIQKIQNRFGSRKTLRFKAVKRPLTRTGAGRRWKKSVTRKKTEPLGSQTGCSTI